jgi:hypothetical protein
MVEEQRFFIGGQAPLETMWAALSHVVSTIDWDRKPKEFVIDCPSNLNDLPNMNELITEALRERVLPAGFLHGLRQAVPRTEGNIIIIKLIYKDTPPKS